MLRLTTLEFREDVIVKDNKLLAGFQEVFDRQEGLSDRTERFTA